MPSYSNNYSKWDHLEVSDDSDIEGHPNVDKKSLIRWKQRDIHEKRELRKQRIAEFEAEIKSNAVLLPRLKDIAQNLESNGPSYYSSLVERLKTQGSPDAPTNLPNQPTYDQMIESLLVKVSGEVKDKGITGGDELGPALVKELKSHIDQLSKRNKEAQKSLEFEKKEQGKHITSDDLKEGWSNTYVPPKPEPVPVPVVKPKAKASETTIEVLNAPSTSSSAEKPENTGGHDEANSDDDDGGDDEDEDELPTMTPSLIEFSKIPYKGFERSYEFLKRDRNVLVPGATDALLLQAFNAESGGDKKYAKQCVHQGLLIQYCEKLGRDGVSLFFKRMVSGDPRALDVFIKDVEDTYAVVAKRAKVTKEEQENQVGVEQIQLVAENPDTVISFDVPDGPPPENLVLEGPGTEDLDIEEVRKSLQIRWEVFNNFEEKFKKALISNDLEKVNKVLGKMPVAEAEQVVGLLQVAGILNFAEGGIRDETGNQAEVAPAA